MAEICSFHFNNNRIGKRSAGLFLACLPFSAFKLPGNCIWPWEKASHDENAFGLNTDWSLPRSQALQAAAPGSLAKCPGGQGRHTVLLGKLGGKGAEWNTVLGYPSSLSGEERAEHDTDKSRNRAITKKELRWSVWTHLNVKGPLKS